jgi:hypothetical protein
MRKSGRIEISRKAVCRVLCLQHSQAARVEGKGTEIHKRLRMPNTDGRRSLLIPVRARVGKRSRTKPGESH